jgi:hypothetical protein
VPSAVEEPGRSGSLDVGQREVSPLEQWRDAFALRRGKDVAYPRIRSKLASNSGVG